MITRTGAHFKDVTFCWGEKPKVELSSDSLPAPQSHRREPFSIPWYQHGNHEIYLSKFFKTEGKVGSTRYCCVWRRCSSSSRWPCEPVVGENPLTWQVTTLPRVPTIPKRSMNNWVGCTLNAQAEIWTRTHRFRIRDTAPQRLLSLLVIT